jgi:hypothetical protein
LFCFAPKLIMEKSRRVVKVTERPPQGIGRKI